MTCENKSRWSEGNSRLRVRLKEYMEFRHLFRHPYIFTLSWSRMKTLVLGCEETLQMVEGELDRFFEPKTGNGE